MAIRKSALAGAAAALLVGVGWWLAAGNDDGLCTYADACQCTPIDGRMFLWAGALVGVPCGAVSGAAAAGLATRLPLRIRRGVLVAIAAGIAAVLVLLVSQQLRCSTDPTFASLWVRAFVPLAFAAIYVDSALR
jgi:hypothetical protein